MAKESYYLRHKLDQGLYIYIELAETWEDSFLMEFRITEFAPHFFRTGVLYENRHILLAFKYIAITDVKEILLDKKIEWIPIIANERLKASAQTFIESFLKNDLCKTCKES